MAAQALMPELEKEAKKRQEEHGGTAPGRTRVTLDGKSDQVFPDPYTDVVKPHDHRNPRAADYAAKLAGVDASTIYKAKQLVERAKAEPQAAREVAQAAREGE